MTPLGIAKHSHMLCLAHYHTCFHSSLHVVHLGNHCLTAHADTLRRISQAQHPGVSCIRHTSQAFCSFADSGELADLLEMSVIRHTSQAFCLFADPGELADLLEMPVPDLALKLIPAALPKLTEDQNTAALEALAHSVGYGLQQMMLDYGFHVVAKYLYGGWSELSFAVDAS